MKTLLLITLWSIVCVSAGFAAAGGFTTHPAAPPITNQTQIQTMTTGFALNLGPGVYNLSPVNCSSASMSPGIRCGDTVLSEKAENLHVGDIITFPYNGATYIHRIISIDGSTITTRDETAYQDADYGVELSQGEFLSLETRDLSDLSGLLYQYRHQFRARNQHQERSQNRRGSAE